MLSGTNISFLPNHLKRSHVNAVCRKYGKATVLLSNRRLISNTRNKNDQLFLDSQNQLSSKVSSDDIQALNHPKMGAEYSPTELLSAYQFNLQDLAQRAENSDGGSSDTATENLSVFLREQRNKYATVERKLNENYLSAVDSSLKVQDYDETIKKKQDIITTKLNFFNSALSNNMFLTAFNILVDLKASNQFSEQELFSKYMVYLTSLINAKETSAGNSRSKNKLVVTVEGLKKVICRDIENSHDFAKLTDIPILALFLQQLVKTEFNNNFENILSVEKEKLDRTANLINSNFDLINNLTDILTQEEYISYDVYKILYMIPEFKQLILHVI